MLLFTQLGIAGDNTPATVANGWYPVSQLGQTNLAFHGTFDGTDGDGDAASIILPYGWTNRFTTTTGTHAYTDPVTITEGEGLMFVHTNAADGTDSGITQVLGGLKKSTRYHFTVRVNANAGDTCQLRVEGTGVTTLPASQEAETTGTQAFETLDVWAQTDATPNDLTIILQAPDFIDVCSWKHVMVTERVQVAPTPGIIVVNQSTTPAEACTNAYSGCNDIVTVTVNPPSSGYYISVRGKIFLSASDDDSDCEVELTENTVQVDEVEFLTGNLEGDNSGMFLHVDYITTRLLVPGTPLTYTMNAKENDGNCSVGKTATLTAILMRSGS